MPSRNIGFAAVAGTRHRLPQSERQRVLMHLRREVPMFWHIVTGDAPEGGDEIGRAFGAEHGNGLFVIAAPWKAIGKSAGPVRNEVIARVTNRLFAFPCKHSIGTYDTMRRCKERGIPDNGFMVQCEEE